jgi:hypothetical protein
MTFNQASMTFKSAFLTDDLKRGVCATNGIEGKGVLAGNSKWYVDLKKPDFKINKKGFTFNGFWMDRSKDKKTDIYQPQTKEQWLASVARVDFVRNIKFTEIDTIMVRPNPSAMLRRCPRPDGHTEITIELDDFGHWFTLIIKNEEVDALVAAMKFLAPNAKFSG